MNTVQATNSVHPTATLAGAAPSPAWQAPVEATFAAAVPARVFVPTALLSLKLALAMLAPLVMSLYVARLVARQGDLVFSGYSIVTSTNTALFIVVSSFLQVLYFLGGRALGSQDRAGYDAAIKVGMRCALFVGVGVSIVSALAGPILSIMGYEPNLVALVRWQGLAAALGLLPPLLLVIYRVHASLNERAGFITVLTALGAVAGVVLATVVTMRLGSKPEAVALGILFTLSAVSWATLAVAWLGLRSLRAPRSAGPADPDVQRQAWKDLWFYGWPIAVVVLMDNALTLSSTLAMGRWWIDVVPVHSAVVLWLAVGLIVPLGIAQAGVQKVAIANASGDIALRNRYAAVTLWLGAIYGVLAAVLINIFAVQAGSLLLPGVEINELTRTQLRQMMLPGSFVLATEGFIVIAAALLRGVGLTRTVLFQALVGYAVFGTGAQYLFSHVLGYGYIGVWWGLVLAFGITALSVTMHCMHQLGIGFSRAS